MRAFLWRFVFIYLFFTFLFFHAMCLTRTTPNTEKDVHTLTIKHARSRPLLSRAVKCESYKSHAILFQLKGKRNDRSAAGEPTENGGIKRGVGQRRKENLTIFVPNFEKSDK